MSAAAPDKAERINPRYAQAIECLLDGRATTQKQAAKLAGVPEEHLCRVIKRPHYQRYITDRASQYLKGIPAIRATAVLAKLTSAASEDVRSKVATRIVEHAGILTSQASATGAIAGAVPLLTIVMRHQAIDGSSVSAAVQVGTQGADNAAIASTSPAEPAPTQEGGGPGGHE